MRINENYLKLKAGYLFPEIGRRVKAYTDKNPDKKIIRLGIGDVVLPLSSAVLKGFHDGVDEMGKPESFKGYGPEQGYGFLRELISEKDYGAKNIQISPDEIFVSDGAKCDSGNIQEIFSTDCSIAVTDPVYPVYVDTNVMAGRTGDGDENGMYGNITYLPCNEENNFIPSLPKEKVDLIYLCYPNNPTGATATKEELKKWVDYARANGSIILFDAAYEAFISEPDIPRSIFEIEGAREVALEFKSLSKTAGFTGTRLGYTVVPKELMGVDGAGNKHSIHSLWNRRQATKFNGVSYPVQKAAAAVFSAQGQKEIGELISYYMENAKTMREALSAMGFKVYGGTNAPYVWVKTKGTPSWELFDLLLEKAGVVGTPGSGFGASGEGYFRFSAFATHEAVAEAMEKVKAAL